jgi:hypothetical protein
MAPLTAPVGVFSGSSPGVTQGAVIKLGACHVRIDAQKFRGVVLAFMVICGESGVGDKAYHHDTTEY